jgi:hypothetical protein
MKKANHQGIGQRAIYDRLRKRPKLY